MPGNQLVYLGQIVETLIMRHNALQGPITSISVGLSAMEARHRPCGDRKVVDDRDDDNTPGVLQSSQVRSSAIINRWISSLVFGSFSTIHTTTDLGSREKSSTDAYVG